MGIKKNILLNFFFGFLFSADIIGTDNQLIKAFWHIGILKDNIALYFKSDPSLKLISKKKTNDLIQEIYQIAKSKLINTSELLEMVKKINEKKHPFYRVNIENIDNNLQIKIIYDAKFVKKVTPMSFNAISLFKGINFAIAHEDIKDYLKNPEYPIGRIKNINAQNVILDCGHGGEDSGAIGTNKIKEKELTLKIGLKLKKHLEKENYNVFLTRNTDKFVSLDQRTTMGNILCIPSIFVSIHANHSYNPNASGLETYYADSSLLNQYHFKDGNTIISPIDDKIKNEQNKLFASLIHSNVYKSCKELNNDLIDRKIRKSISQILLGTEMPTVLIELGFVSNKDECELLSSDKYQDLIVIGIVNGIEKYFESQNNRV